MRVVIAVVVLLSFAACGSETENGAAEEIPELSGFYMQVDLAPLKTEFEPRFTHHTRTSARYSTGGKGIGFDGYWHQDLLFEGPLAEGDDAKKLFDDVVARVRAATSTGGAAAGELRSEDLGGRVMHTLPYKHERNEGEWRIEIGPGAADGEVLLTIGVREKQRK